jgi:hypothetical protein
MMKLEISVIKLDCLSLILLATCQSVCCCGLYYKNMTIVNDDRK